jgi:glucose-6-phosphate 1-epimerase
VAGPFTRARVVVVVLLLLLRLMSMGHCSEQRPGFEVTKDWNGADQVAIRSPRGASVRVSPLLPGIFVRRFRRAIGSAFLSLSRGAWPDASVRLWEQVCLHGGQVVSWRNDRGEELLFTSSKVSLLQLPMLVVGSYLLQC